MSILFLEGEMGIGKTTLLLECSKLSGRKGSGYITQRVVDEQGSTVGFQLVNYNQVKASVTTDI